MQDPPISKVFQPSGEKHVKNIFIKDLSAKDTVYSSFLVKSKDVPVARNGKPFLVMNLADKTGEIDSRTWENAEEMGALVKEGAIIAVGGKIHSFQNRLQLIVDHLVPLPEADIQLEDYLTSSGEDLEALYAELIALFEEVENPWIKKLSLSLLKDPQIAPRYKVCPAAKTIHHAYIGGLLCHSLQLIKLVNRVASLYKDLDTDILMFGAAFHDFGKIFELSYDRTFGYTDEGKLVGHISIGLNLIDRKIQLLTDFPKDLELQLKHIVLAHHGKLEYGSPKKPATIEALILASLDDLDSKIESIQTHMKKQVDSNRWTAAHRAYDQYYYRPDSYL